MNAVPHRHGGRVHRHAYSGPHRHWTLPHQSRRVAEHGNEHAHPHDHHHHDHELADDGHGHSHGLVDRSIVRSHEGVKAVSISLAVLGIAAAAQTIVFALSGSV